MLKVLLTKLRLRCFLGDARPPGVQLRFRVDKKVHILDERAALRPPRTFTRPNLVDRPERVVRRFHCGFVIWIASWEPVFDVRVDPALNSAVPENPHRELFIRVRRVALLRPERVSTSATEVLPGCVSLAQPGSETHVHVLVFGVGRSGFRRNPSVALGVGKFALSVLGVSRVERNPYVHGLAPARAAVRVAVPVWLGKGAPVAGTPLITRAHVRGVRGEPQISPVFCGELRRVLAENGCRVEGKRRAVPVAQVPELIRRVLGSRDPPLSSVMFKKSLGVSNAPKRADGPGTNPAGHPNPDGFSSSPTTGEHVLSGIRLNPLSHSTQVSDSVPTHA